MTLGTLYATWGLGVDSTDWNLAAEKAAIRVHEANPNMLIIVGGIFTGGFLSPAFYAPVIVPNQVRIKVCKIQKSKKKSRACGIRKRW